MIKKLLLSLFIFASCFGAEKDPFAGLNTALGDVHKEIDQINTQKSRGRVFIPNSSDTPKDNELVIKGMDKVLKSWKKEWKSNANGMVLLITSAIFTIISARAFLIKKTPMRSKFLFASLVSLAGNPILTYIYNKKYGGVSLISILVACFHKEVSRTVLSKEIFNLIYNYKKV
ncbi:MAG: hypothetical protein P4L22_04655 [Candidatus Babeliales bacterium]|nr:hypothetical protein [Candidatus Babeliales bacterium]